MPLLNRKLSKKKLREQRAGTKRRTGQECPAVIKASLIRACAFFDSGNSSHGEQSWRRGVLALPLPYWMARHKPKEYNSQISAEWLYPHVLLPVVVNSTCPPRRFLCGQPKGSAAASMYFLKWWIIFCQVKNCILRRDKSKIVISCTSVALPPLLCI